MKIRFWGVRGSFAMCGTEFLRYGGNTTSIELVSNAGARLLVDLGTGATEYGKQLMGCEFSRGEGRLPVLLSHTHLDHIQGLPFFTPFFIKGNQIRILGADPVGSSLKQTLQNQLAPHYSPLGGLENLAAGVSIEVFVPGGELSVDGFEVTTAAVPHGNMWTTGFRIKADGKVVTILSGVIAFDLKLFILSAIVARGGKFFLLAWALRTYGVTIVDVIERRFAMVAIGGAAVLAAVWLGFKYLA